MAGKNQDKNEQAKAEAAARVTKARETTERGQTAEGDKLTTHELAQMQFPATAGAPEVEIAKRTQDNDGAVADTRFRKTFVALPTPGVNLETDFHTHEACKLATLEQAIQQGLHPDAEATFDGAEQHPDGVSVCLKYSVAVTPASIDDDANNTVSPYRVLNERLDGSTSNAEENTDKAEVTRESASQPAE